MVSISQTTKRILALGTLVLGVLALTPTAAGAQDGCGEYSYGFAGTRLLNDGISNSAGPFTIDLPAGTYDVTLVSHDTHSEQADPTQPEEQWYVQLDGSWTSPLTPDLADNLDNDSVTFTALKVPAATQISVHHRGVGGVNSIDVVCVGFTTVADVDEPVTEIVPPVDPILPEPPEVEEPVTELVPPAGPIVNPPTDTTEEPEIEVAGPTPDLAPPVSPDPPADPIEPEVLGETETPAAPQLALTGPTETLWGLTVTGVAMILFGVLLVGREARRQN